MFLLTFLLAVTSFADEVVVSQAEQVCRVEQFVAKKAKGGAKACDSLRDTAEVKVKSMEVCKQRALDKAAECLKRLAEGAEQVSVFGKLTEKFKVSSTSTKFTCEVDKLGGSACP